MDLEQLYQVSNGARVVAAPDGLHKMGASHERLLDKIKSGEAIYGVTTGLGAKVKQALTPEEINTFSLNTIRGRAHAIGPQLPKDIIRAAMALRINTLLSGLVGASPMVVEHLVACLDADLIPKIGAVTSIGPADLMWGGSFALALVGEGEFIGQADSESSAVALQLAGIPPLKLGPRDGLALVSHSCISLAIAALGVHRARHIFGWAQMAVSMTLEGFRANLSPFREGVLQVAGQNSALAAAQEIRTNLTGSALFEPNQARRLQDPLSLRNVAQVHGSVLASLDGLDNILTPAINGSSDSPIMPDGGDEVYSTGNFLNPALTIGIDGLNRSFLQMAAAIHARISRLLSSRFTDLPNGLNNAAAGNVGLGALTKLSEGLFAEISHLAATPPIYPSHSADGVEDQVSFSAISAKSLLAICEHLTHLIAIEAIVAAQAIELRGVDCVIAPRVKDAVRFVRQSSAFLMADRPLGKEIELLGQQIARRIPSEICEEFPA